MPSRLVQLALAAALAALLCLTAAGTAIAVPNVAAASAPSKPHTTESITK